MDNTLEGKLKKIPIRLTTNAALYITIIKYIKSG